MATWLIFLLVAAALGAAWRYRDELRILFGNPVPPLW